MQLGMVGLGRMGSGMTKRLEQHGHELKTYDPNVGSTAKTLRALAKQLDAPRHIWLMVPSGKVTEDTFQKLLDIVEPGDTIVDGGNSNFRDSKRRYAEARKRKVAFVDVGVSGGIWGLEVGFCLMAGGDKAPVKRLRPIFEALAPENGWAHVGTSGAGHFTKMVHNGIEYGLMQAYAEGFELMHHSEFELDLSEIAGIWRYGSVVRSWLLELLHEALEQYGDGLDSIAPVRRGLRRGPLDDQRGDQRQRAGAGDHRGTLLALRLASRDRLLGEGAGRAPEPVRRARGEGRQGGEEGARPAVSVADDGNPLLEGLRLRRSPDSCAIVVFGATGDLTRRKIFPALYALALRRLLPERFGVVGVARTEQTTKQWIADMKKAVREHARDDFDAKVWSELADGMRYVATDFAEDEGQDRVVDALRDLDEQRGCSGNRLYYLAVPPAAFETIVNELGERRSTEGWIRLIVEKPFGHDRDSAHRLNEILQQYFTENEIFRIDHYLGKETVQNMLALRFANGIFEPIWNRQFIDHVQITVGESIGIEGRAAFYEQAGVIRDVFQNHLLQLVALTAMEPPIDFTADSVRNEKVKVLRSLHTPGPKSVVRGQYARGFIEGEEVPGYREEPGVAGDSATETYIAAKLYVDNWRWADTPFYVRAGKRLPRRETTIAIQFQRAPHPPFAEIAGEGLRPNVLLIHVQPDEGVSLAIGAKVPGAGMSIRTVHMDFLYGGAFRTGLPEAYERLILDAMLGDATLFTRSDEVDEQWGLVDAIVAAWKRDRPNFPNYPAGSWGPSGADELIRRDGRSWRRH